MARKTQEALRPATKVLTPVSLERATESFLKRLAATPVPEGTEEQYAQWMKAQRELEEEQVRNDKLFTLAEKGKSLREFDESIVRLHKLTNRVMSACDQWRHTCVHMHDKLEAAAEDVRATVIDSLADKLDELEFSVNFGLLGSHVATAIRADVTEGELEPQFCEECSG